ncbi:MAG: protein translocase subunit SecF [Clostridia bacterium]|nr:protein translocase subunit SecF [Clostridia bacterium]
MNKKHPFSIVEMQQFFIVFAVTVIILGFVGATVSYIFRDNPDIGIKWGIDFTGGTVFNFSLMRDATEDDVQKIANIIKDETGSDASLVQITEVSAVDIEVLKSTDIVVVKSGTTKSEDRKAVIFAIAEEFELPYELDEEGGIDTTNVVWLLSSDTVGPAAASDLMRSAVLGISVAAVLMLLYISIRFDLFSGIAAVVALLHDVSMMIIFTYIFGVQVNLPFIAAILTILGYSINATIIIFDRVRENVKLNDGKTFDEVVENSIWQTMNRSIFTSLTTLFTVSALYFLSVPSIKEFAFPIIIGIIAGFVSSVFISGNVWVLLKNKYKKSE